MNASAIKKQVDQGLSQLAKALEKGKSDELERYLATMARFHRYSFTNVMLIFAQKPTATHVAGFGTWKQLGRRVMKGEKGIAIMAPVKRSKGEQEDEDDDRDDRIIAFRRVHVFDIAQTEGQPLPEPQKTRGDPGAYLDKLERYITQLGIKLEAKHLPLSVQGTSSGGRICVQRGLPPPEQFSVLIHELAHELLHQSRTEKPSKTVRETEAEAVAFVVSHAIGLHAGTASSDYIQLYDGNAETLAASLQRVQRAARQIISAISPYRSRHQKE